MSKCNRCGDREPCGCAEKDRSRNHNTARASEKNHDEISCAKSKANEGDDQEVKYHRKQ